MTHSVVYIYPDALATSNSSNLAAHASLKFPSELVNNLFIPASIFRWYVYKSRSMGLRQPRMWYSLYIGGVGLCPQGVLGAVNHVDFPSIRAILSQHRYGGISLRAVIQPHPHPPPLAKPPRTSPQAKAQPHPTSHFPLLLRQCRLPRRHPHPPVLFHPSRHLERET